MLPDAPLWSTVADLRNDFDYDLTNRQRALITPPEGSVTAQYDEHSYLDTEAVFDGAPNEGAALQAGTPGVDDGSYLPGLNDGFMGTGPDRGAVELGDSSWIVGPEAHVHVGPVAAGTLEILHVGENSLELAGDASASTHDPKGWIVGIRGSFTNKKLPQAAL